MFYRQLEDQDDADQGPVLARNEPGSGTGLAVPVGHTGAQGTVKRREAMSGSEKHGARLTRAGTAVAEVAGLRV